jgi:methyltransferase
MLTSGVPALLFVLAFVPMVLEARRSAANERALRARGAVEPEAEVYPVMLYAYPAAFLAMIGEAWLRDAAADALFAAGLALFLAAKALKYWAIATLGVRWTFKVLVPPGSTRILAGPYRWLDHPNYAGVAGELIGMALMAHALVTGPLAVAGFGLLLRGRVRVEERALRM